VGKIDKLLITQASLLSQGLSSNHKLKSLKSRLPIITTPQYSINSSQAASHSYGKMGKLSETLAESEGSLRMLKEGLDVYYANIVNKTVVFFSEDCSS